MLGDGWMDRQRQANKMGSITKATFILRYTYEIPV